MPIIIAGTLDFDAATAERTLIDAEPLIAAALAEPGCRAYSWGLDPLAPGRVHVFELWDDEASLTAHFCGDPFREMGAHLTTAGFTNMTVHKYRSDLAEPIYDDSGTPRANFISGR